MHEFTIAGQIVDKIFETAAERGAKKIHRVEILVGEREMHGEEQLEFWLEKMLSSKGEIAKDVKVDIKKNEGEGFILKRIEIDM